ncbi:hypothetical protein [Capillibacterium thermochitinicola]|nr:hypothetical protein [Capillibacterium thermochitinicola]
MLILFPTLAAARLNNIAKEKLDLTAELEAVLAEIEAIESLVYAWTPEWNYATPKEDVIALITSGYKLLAEHAALHPDNGELYLLMGLLAHYGYQLDLEEFYQLAEDAYTKAAALDPGDFRPRWFMAMHRIKAIQVVEGMEVLLAIAAAHQPAELPPEFWEDYAYAAVLASMPSHAVMALTYAHEILGYAGYMERLLGQIVQNRFLPLPAEASVDNEKLWQFYADETGFKLVNRLFGFSLTIPAEWDVRVGPMQNRSVAVLVKPPGKRGFQGSVLPSILLFARRPEVGETLDDFLSTVLGGQAVRELGSMDGRKTYELETPELYPAEGGGYCYVTGDQRTAPRFPGILLEEPRDVPRQGEGVHYYAAGPVYRRFDGEIYYLLLLDTALSVKEEALRDYQQVLAGLVIE